MTPRYAAMLLALAQRDASFLQLAGLAFSVVLAGILIPAIIPPRWRGSASFLWAVSAWGVYLITLFTALI